MKPFRNFLRRSGVVAAVFVITFLPLAANDTADAAPKLTKEIDPEFPPALRAQGVNGEVIVELDVDAKGLVTDARAISSTHADFAAPAVAAARRWKFKPGTRGSEATAMTVRMPVRFQSDMFDLTAAKPAAPETSAIPSSPPAPRKPIRVVYPYDLALAGQSGWVVAGCVVDATGIVRDAAIAEASAPAWGAAVRAAIEAASFEPAQRGGVAVEAKWSSAFDLGGEKSGASIDTPTAELIVELRSGRKPATPRELDAIPQRRSGSSPRLPIDLLREGRGGSATIELFLGPDGRVLLMRAAKADDERLAWAAMTAMLDWKFDVPRKNGEPTFARLGVPVNFAAPKVAAVK